MRSKIPPLSILHMRSTLVLSNTASAQLRVTLVGLWAASVGGAHKDGGERIESPVRAGFHPTPSPGSPEYLSPSFFVAVC